MSKVDMNTIQKARNSSKEEPLSIEVTKVGNVWHSRLYYHDNLIDEMACAARMDIGWISREMLKWYDKGLGPVSTFASQARKRHTKPAAGKVWYRGQLNDV